MGAETIVGLFMALVGMVVMYGSQQQGTGWVSGAPQPGYFPFRVGLLLTASSLLSIVIAYRTARQTGHQTFATTQQLGLVAQVLWPLLIYVGLIKLLGIYVASALYLMFFMGRTRSFPWWKVLAVSGLTVVAFYLIFEVWFKIPLPKGPLEAALGLH